MNPSIEMPPVPPVTAEQNSSPDPAPEQSVQEINKAVQNSSAWVGLLKREVEKNIIGQERLVERLLIGLLSGGHILLEGLPGLAKTLAVKTLAAAVSTDFRRIQFTPDMLPADIMGTEIYNPQNTSFEVKQGPIFSSIILADEINRAPSKVQSALLEAMQEKQVTIGDTTHDLPRPFLVMATQNPIEQEGTYPLPEAQVDRFMLKLNVSYPSKAEERQIMDRMTDSTAQQPQRVITPEALLQALGEPENPGQVLELLLRPGPGGLPSGPRPGCGMPSVPGVKCV